jgi:hypothetical protein
VKCRSRKNESRDEKAYLASETGEISIDRSLDVGILISRAASE